MLLQRQPVDVGGTSFNTVVLGEGQPTVVFVNGLGSPLEEWVLVAPAIAERSRVVCYDRRTAPEKGPLVPHDAESIAADLHDLLKALDVTGPVVLVGHSWGGAVIRRYAYDHGDGVAGMVFVDASHEGMKAMIPKRPRLTMAIYTSTTIPLRFGPIRRRLLRMLGFDRLPPAERDDVYALPWLAKGRTGRAEYAGIGPSLLELGRLAPDLPSVPSRVLLAGGRAGWMAKAGAKQAATVRAVWEQAVAGRSDITLRSVAGSGHYICLDEPQAVIDAITEVLGEVSRGPARTAPSA